ncbi:hypothetical protein BDF19DRAFT_431376 [Syncephalis fuscata]|nr:hypothetical protein BDF19DRAFT_431376 [Syncephalis fuscata]
MAVAFAAGFLAGIAFVIICLLSIIGFVVYAVFTRLPDHRGFTKKKRRGTRGRNNRQADPLGLGITEHSNNNDGEEEIDDEDNEHYYRVGWMRVARTPNPRGLTVDFSDWGALVRQSLKMRKNTAARPTISQYTNTWSMGDDPAKTVTEGMPIDGDANIPASAVNQGNSVGSNKLSTRASSIVSSANGYATSLYRRLRGRRNSSSNSTSALYQSGSFMQKQMEREESQQQQQQHPEIDTFFAVLKYDTLFLYDTDEQLDCRGVILTSLHDVSIYPQELPENEIFLKDTPIRLTRRHTEHDDVMEEGSRDYYLFINAPVEKEDWYFALLKSNDTTNFQTSSANSTNSIDTDVPSQSCENPLTALHFDVEAMRRVIGQVYSDADSEQSVPWLNALIGRLFLSVYKTSELRQHFINKIIKKTKRLRKPDFIDDIRVRDLDVGEQTPHIWDPRLLELSPDGTLRIALRIRYEGGFKVEIETGAVLSVSSHLRSIHVPVVLSAQVKHFEGRMLVKIKPPPSNRIWVGFFDMPDMDISMEPVYPMITQAILNRVRDMMRETIVLPNMDDMPFFETYGTGGLFGSKIRHPPTMEKQEEEEEKEKASLIAASLSEQPADQPEAMANEQLAETIQEATSMPAAINTSSSTCSHESQETRSLKTPEDTKGPIAGSIKAPQPTDLAATATALRSTETQLPDLVTNNSDTTTSLSSSVPEDGCDQPAQPTRLTASPSLFLSARRPDGGLAGLSRLMQQASNSSTSSTSPLTSSAMLRSRSTEDNCLRTVTTASQPKSKISEHLTSSFPSSSSPALSSATTTATTMTTAYAITHPATIAAMPITTTSWNSEVTRPTSSMPSASTTPTSNTRQQVGTTTTAAIHAANSTATTTQKRAPTENTRRRRMFNSLIDTNSDYFLDSDSANSLRSTTDLTDSWGTGPAWAATH